MLELRYFKYLKKEKKTLTLFPTWYSLNKMITKPKEVILIIKKMNQRICFTIKVQMRLILILKRRNTLM